MMPADGLTKTLTRQKHQAFVKQLGMEDVKDQLVDRGQINSVQPQLDQLAYWYN